MRIYTLIFCVQGAYATLIVEYIFIIKLFKKNDDIILI